MNKRLKGWMGRTHALLSVILMMLCMLIPLEPFQKTFWVLKDNILLFIAGLVILVGGALLPDLDNFTSKAGSTLGAFGSIFTVFMQSTSSIIWTVYHLKGDRKPPSQHRYFWHTPIVGIGLIALFYFGLPVGNYTIITNIQTCIQTKQIGYFIQTNATLLIFMLLAFMATFIGSSMVLARLKKIIPVPYIVNYIFPVAVLVYIFTANYSDLKILGVCLGSGYLFHIIEDFFADTGVPLIFPIPAFWAKKVWWRVHFPFAAKTGGLANTIIDFVAFFLMVGLIIFVFVRR